MAEEQVVRRPKVGEGPIKYGDLFDMSGEMAEQPISPRDAAAMESAENRAFGKTIKGGPASLMRSAAAINVEAGLVASDGLVEGETMESGNAMKHTATSGAGAIAEPDTDPVSATH